MPELLEMIAQVPSLNTKLAMERASQLNRPSAPQAQVAIPFDISWLAVEEVDQQGSGTEAPQHGPRLT